ncbi:TetR/AcrR family transcriptional regulator [Candidatus Clostridium radicumherbarum]|jgi:Transcriptional regulator|uniref:TetR/AcrR family transcriptional regulator n=1 Tax=Candidatus Clostridium radicumherbarum TaxID=3381662 RepID=A0ABW8TR22_9CLOT
MSKDIERKILDATLETIAREKISGTRMHLIAEEANMSQSNLHYYFPTKNDLIIALMDDLQKRFSSKRTESIDVKNKSLNENIHGILEEKKDDILNNKKVDYAQFDFWVQGTVNPEIRVKFQKTFEEWRQNIKEVLKHNKVPSNIDSKNAEMLPFIIVSLMMGASMQYLIDEGKFDLDEYFLACEKLVLDFLENMA